MCHVLTGIYIGKTFLIKLIFFVIKSFFNIFFTEVNSKSDWLKDYRNITEMCCSRNFFHYILILWYFIIFNITTWNKICVIQKLPSRGVLKKRCSDNTQQIYRRTTMPKFVCNFIGITLRHGCSPVNLPHIFRTPFTKNTSERLLLVIDVSVVLFSVI